MRSRSVATYVRKVPTGQDGVIYDVMLSLPHVRHVGMWKLSGQGDRDTFQWISRGTRF